MIDRLALLSDLRDLLKQLEADLLERSESAEVPDVGKALRAEYDRARAAERTAQSYEDWRSDSITQAAAAWVLSCVFVRFLEDNRLIDPPKIAGLVSPSPLAGKGRGEGGDSENRLQCARDEHELYFRNHPKQTDREYLLAVFDQLAELPGTKHVFGEHNPIRELPNWLSGDAAGELLRFFQKIDANSGALVHDFTDANWDTRFLGDLYQDLSESARKKYALLQTPEFVEEFILDRTLDPAIDEFGLEGNLGLRASNLEEGTHALPLSPKPQGLRTSFKMIDPACGSGHFLLGSFRRILDRWQRKEPGTNVRELVQRTLDSIHGVDVNPYAVAIARFRMLLAAMRACGISRLADAPAFHLNVVCGDSLLHAPIRHGGDTAVQPLFEAPDIPDFAHTYAAEDLPELRRILKEGQYHAVVANPPYITPKDRALNEAYRERYRTCHRQYSLAVPFLERIFRLAVEASTPSPEPRPSGSGKLIASESRPSGSGRATPLPDGRGSAGYTGQITANSFMKREFGKKLIEEFFPTVDLTHVIDAQLAHIPGHGKPTVILFGRNRPPIASRIRLVGAIKREDEEPTDPATGLVWSAIVAQLDQPGSQSEFVSVSDSPRELFHRHPWSIGGGGAAELKERLDEGTNVTLSEAIDEIGFLVITGEDNCLLLPRDVIRRASLRHWKPLADGEVIRDWTCETDLVTLWPNTAFGDRLPPEQLAGHLQFLWTFRTPLKDRRAFSVPVEQKGIPWWCLRELYAARLRTPLSIVFSEVATHNHFVLDRGGKVFKQTAPVIKLPALVPEPRPSGSAASEPLPNGRGSGHALSDGPRSMQPVTEEDHLALLGLLNSSVGGFWIKQVCHCKGGGGIGGGIAAESWERFFAFNGTKLQQFPIPLPDGRGSKADGDPREPEPRPSGSSVLHLAQRLDLLAQRLATNSPSAAIARHFASPAQFEPRPSGSGPSPDTLRHPLPDGRGSLKDAIARARQRATTIRSEMVLLQEDLDWECYRLYGLLEENLTYRTAQLRRDHIPESRDQTSQSRDRKGAKCHPKDDHSLTVAAREPAGADDRIPSAPGPTLLDEDWRSASQIVSKAEVEPKTYFVTFTCYGTWLHGDERGSVDCEHNEWQSPSLEPDEERERREFALLKHSPVKLGPKQRTIVHRTIEEVCQHRGWRLHALNVRTNHVHVVVTANRRGKRVYNDFKSYATRRMNEAEALPEACLEVFGEDRFLTGAAPDRVPSRDRKRGLPSDSEPEFKVWTRGGSARVIDWEESFRRAIQYTLREQGPDITPGNAQRDDTSPSSRDRQGAVGVDGEEDRGEDRSLTVAARDSDVAPPLKLGQRAFEIVLARQIAAGETQTTWFERHGSTPITELPAEWPDDYRQLVERRIALIESDTNIRLIERPEYKRRWNTEPWESQLERALREWLLDRLESYFDFDGRMATEARPSRSGATTDKLRYPLPYGRGSLEIALVSVAKLADVARQDAEFLQVGELYCDDPAFDVQSLVAELVATETVPLLPVLRYKPSGLRKRAEWERTWELQRQEDAIDARTKLAPADPNHLTEDAARELKRQQVGNIPVPPKYDSKDFLDSTYWRLRGKLDVPKERWVSFSHCEGPDGTTVIAWAGYNHLQLARAISTYYVEIQERLGGRDDPRLVPLLACLIELLPWLKQWHNEPDAAFEGMRMGDYFENFITDEARGLGKIVDDIKAWTPPARTKGKGRRRST